MEGEEDAVLVDEGRAEGVGGYEVIVVGSDAGDESGWGDGGEVGQAVEGGYVGEAFGFGEGVPCGVGVSWWGWGDGGVGK